MNKIQAELKSVEGRLLRYHERRDELIAHAARLDAAREILEECNTQIAFHEMREKQLAGHKHRQHATSSRQTYQQIKALIESRHPELAKEGEKDG